MSLSLGHIAVTYIGGVMARRSRMQRGRFGAHGGMMRRMGRGGPNGVRMPRSPNDNGPSGE